MTRHTRRAVLATTAALAGIVLHGQPTTADHVLFGVDGIDAVVPSATTMIQRDATPTVVRVNALDQISIPPIAAGIASATDPTTGPPDLGVPPPDKPRPDKPDRPKPDEPKPDNPKPDNPKPDKPKPDEPKPDNPRPDEPKPDEPKPDNPRPDPPDPGGQPDPGPPIDDIEVGVPPIGDAGDPPTPDPEPDVDPGRSAGPGIDATGAEVDPEPVADGPATAPTGRTQELTTPQDDRPGIDMNAAARADPVGTVAPGSLQVVRPSPDRVDVDHGAAGTISPLARGVGPDRSARPAGPVDRFASATEGDDGLLLPELGVRIAALAALSILIAVTRRVISRRGHTAEVAVDHRRDPTADVSAGTRPPRREPTGSVAAVALPSRRNPRPGVGGRPVDRVGRDRMVPRSPPPRFAHTYIRRRARPQLRLLRQAEGGPPAVTRQPARRAAE